MTENQREKEIHNCNKEIAKYKEILQSYTMQYDLIRYNYEPSWVDAKSKLREIIDKYSEQSSLLMIKVRVLTKTSIDLHNLSVEELDDFVRSQILFSSNNSGIE
jgi:hypothetical protein